METNSPQLLAEQGKQAWNIAVSVLHPYLAEPKARTFFGRLLSQNKLHAAEMLEAVKAAERIGTCDPQGYLSAAARDIRARKIDPALKATWT